MSKKLVIKFWWKLWDTLIAVNEIFRSKNTQNFTLCLQNAQVLELARICDIEHYKIPVISKKFSDLVKLFVFLSWLAVFARKFESVIVLEEKSSIWGRLSSFLFPWKKIDFLKHNVLNSYAMAHWVLADHVQSWGSAIASSVQSLQISEEVLEFSRWKYILLGLWSETWRYRSMDSETWIELIRLIHQDDSDIKIALIWRWANDSELASEILQCTELNEYVITFVDKTTISELVYLMQHAHYNVMIDSGLAHLAHLCTPPEIFVFWPDIPQKWFPQWYSDRFFYYKPLNCSPCPQNWHDRSAVCINKNEQWECLRGNWTAQSIFDLIRKLNLR